MSFTSLPRSTITNAVSMGGAPEMKSVDVPEQSALTTYVPVAAAFVTAPVTVPGELSTCSKLPLPS
jgi:hypothetical protein